MKHVIRLSYNLNLGAVFLMLITAHKQYFQKHYQVYLQRSESKFKSTTQSGLTESWLIQIWCVVKIGLIFWSADSLT